MPNLATAIKNLFIILLVCCLNTSVAHHLVFENGYEPIDFCAIDTPQNEHSYFVSIDGLPSATGTQQDPLDLATALSSSSPAQAGDTIWVAGGIYHGTFTSELRGHDGAPITIRPLPGEHVIIDSNIAQPTGSALTINGYWSIYRDFEVLSTNGNRISAFSGSNPTDIDLAGGLNIFASHIKVINFIIHDSSCGISFWRPAIDSELYGNIIYNNGWSGPDRGHGHAIYTQNETGTKRIENNIIFFGFGTGIHAYTEGGSIQGFDILNNVWYQTGASDPRASQRKDNCLVGGFQPVARLLLKNNQGWSLGRGTRIGYGGSVDNLDATFIDNYLAEGLWFAGNWNNLNLQNNHIYGDLINVDTGSFSNNVFLPEHPSNGTKVFIQPNKYDFSRARLSIYNYAEQDSVLVDPSEFLKVGDGFEIRSVFDLNGSAIVSGFFDGTDISIPMGTVIPPQPFGLDGGISGDDDPGKKFATFLIKRTSCSATP